MNFDSPVKRRPITQILLRLSFGVALGWFRFVGWFGFVGWCGLTQAADNDASLVLVAPASDEPVGSLAAVRVAEGWRRSLFAAEPNVANIVAFDIDYQGNLFVCESFRQERGVTDNRGHDEEWLLADLASQSVQQRIDYHKRLLGDAVSEHSRFEDRIRRVRDLDGDGTADDAVIVADGFSRLEEGTGAGVLVRGQEVFYTCIPKLWKLIDDNDDGQSDRRVVLSDGYGVRVAFRGHDLHGPIIGPDGRLYFSIGDRGYSVTTNERQMLSNPSSGAVFRCELDGSKLEVIATGLRNPQELAFDDFGDLFTVDNNSDSGDRARITQIVRGGDSGWRMHYQYLPDRGPFGREKLWQPYHPDQSAYIIPPIANLTDGPAGLAFDPGTGGDRSLRGRFLVCDFRGSPGASGVRSFRLEPQGAFYRLADHAEPIWGLLATDVAFGPDGAIWVSDWVEGWDGVGKGRVYRFLGPDNDPAQNAEVNGLLKQDWSVVPADRLEGLLAHADRRVRNESQWQLAERGEAERLIHVASNKALTRLARLHGVWGAEQSVRLKKAGADQLSTVSRGLIGLLKDPDEYVRAAAADAVGDHQWSEGENRLVEMLADPAARARMHAALALAALGPAVTDPTCWDRLVELLTANEDRDPIERHAAIVALAATANAKRLAGLGTHPSVSVRRAAVVALRRRGDFEVAQFLQDTSAVVVAEAARAIHDQPIAAGLDSLAGLLATGVSDDGVMRRVLNANYRLGTPEAAAALAAYAAVPTNPIGLRLEAIKMLADWGRPDPRDRVLNEYRPLPERPAAVAKSALAKVLPTILKNADEARELAIVVGADYGIPEVVPVLLSRVADTGLKPESRADSLRSLGRLRPEAAAQAALGLTDSSETRLRIAAMETLAEVSPEQGVDLVIKGVDSEVLSERQTAWDLAAKYASSRIDERISRGVADLVAGTFPPDTALNLFEAASAREGLPWTELLRGHQEKLQAENPLGRWWFSLSGGDPRKGAEVFKRTQLSCVRCHRVGKEGGEVGPNLSSIGKFRDRAYLLESICLPDARIAEGFETVVIADDAGQVHTGIVQGQDDQSVRLIRPDGTSETILRDSIVDQKRGKSAMPEELVQYLTPRELRDLVAYLAGLQADPMGVESAD